MNHTVAEKLPLIRRKLHFEHSDVARCIGVNVDKVQKFELGAVEPTLSELCALLATFMTRFDTAFRNELDDAMAGVYARIADYVPPKSNDPRTANRANSYLRLKDYLNQPHGGAL